MEKGKRRFRKGRQDREQSRVGLYDAGRFLDVEVAHSDFNTSIGLSSRTRLVADQMATSATAASTAAAAAQAPRSNFGAAVIRCSKMRPSQAAPANPSTIPAPIGPKAWRKIIARTP